MRRSLRAVLVGAVASLAVAAGGTSGAKGGLTTCNESSLRPFAPWGDYSLYKLAPNGSLAEGAEGWTLSGGARVVADGNPYVSGKHSLLLPAGASATAPAACARLADLASRFFVRNTGAAGATLRVDVTYKTLLGSTATGYLGTISAGGAWQPSPKYDHVLTNLLGTLALSSDVSASLRFRFTAKGTGAAFQVDDLFVDPLLQV